MNSDKIGTIWNSCISLATKNQACTCQQSFPSSCDQVMEVFSSSATIAEYSSLTRGLCLHIHPNSAHGIAIPFTDSVLQWNPSGHQHCDVTTTQNSLVLFCTGLRNSILFHLTAASPSKRRKMHSQNKTFSKREQCCKNSISLASLCTGCGQVLCLCNISSQQTQASHKSKVKDHKAHETLHCADDPTKHHRLEHLPSTTE